MMMTFFMIAYKLETNKKKLVNQLLNKDLGILCYTIRKYQVNVIIMPDTVYTYTQLHMCRAHCSLVNKSKLLSLWNSIQLTVPILKPGLYHYNGKYYSDSRLEYIKITKKTYCSETSMYIIN